MDRRWIVGLFIIVGLIATSWGLAYCYGERGRPHLLVVAEHDLSGNHKLSADDLAFAVTRSVPPKDAVARPEAALGACTKLDLPAEQPVEWGQLRPAGSGDGTCASSALALELLTRLATAAAPADAAGQDAAKAAPEWLKSFSTPQAELPPSSEAALGEFRAEFVKELAKHLADTVADKALGKSPPKSAGEVSTTSGRMPKELAKITYFDFGSAELNKGERVSLANFAAGYLHETSCRITVFAYADRVGGQERNLWLSWQRGMAVKEALVDSGIDRRLVTVVPRGFEEPSIDATTSAPAALNRRAETYATCPP